MLTKKQKGFSTVLIIVIVLVVIVGGVLAWQYWPREAAFSVEQGQPETGQPVVVDEGLDETAGWQTYRNEEYRFEVKYPKDWHIFQDTMVGDLFAKGSLTADDVALGNYTDDNCFLVLLVVANPEKRPLADFQVKYARFGAEIIQLGSVNFLKWAMQIEGKEGKFSEEPFYLIMNKDNMPFMFSSKNNQANQDCQEEIVGILSTLALN